MDNEDNARKVMLEHAYGARMWENEEDAHQDEGYALWADLVVAGCGVLAWCAAGWYLFNNYTF